MTKGKQVLGIVMILALIASIAINGYLVYKASSAINFAKVQDQITFMRLLIIFIGYEFSLAVPVIYFYLGVEANSNNILRCVFTMLMIFLVTIMMLKFMAPTLASLFFN